MTQIKLIEERFRDNLSQAIAKGESDNVKQIIEDNDLDVDSYIDSNSYMPLVMKITLSYGYKDEKDRDKILKYILTKGVNPNRYCKDGYNTLHIVAQQETQVGAMHLFLDYGGDPNLPDNNGATVAYWVIQNFPWRTEGDERQRHLDVVKKIMKLGADLDCANKFGVTPRSWLEHTSDDVKELVTECEKLNSKYIPSGVTMPKFPTNEKYPEILDELRKLIPAQGQAETTESEMLRCLNILKDEACRNGNANFNKSHKELAEFISKTLTSSNCFDEKTTKKIVSNSKKLMSARKPYLEDDVYDFLSDQICVYFLKNRKL